MSSADVNQVFSVPFRHRWSTHFGGDLTTSKTRPLGLARFIGDEPNQLLKYLVSENQPLDLKHPRSRFQYPIVLFGPSGTGKTSLALTIVADLTENSRAITDPGKTTNSSTLMQSNKPVFLTSLDFDRRYRASLETDSIVDFRNRLIQSSGIVIDDLQRLINKPAAQTEFTMMLDKRCQKNRPTVVTMDVSPQLCNGLSAQLVSRLSAGLGFPVHPPGPLARKEIICDLAKINQIELTRDAIDLLVERLNVTVPKLGHVFAQLKTALKSYSNENASELCFRSVDAKTLLLIFKRSDSDLEQRSLLITKKVAREFHLKVSELKGNSRKQSIVMARGIAIYLNRILLGNSFLKIGVCFGNRDHSTIMHAYRKIDRLVMGDDAGTIPTSTKTIVEKLHQQLTEQFASQISFF